jgi:hypothetical protein
LKIPQYRQICPFQQAPKEKDDSVPPFAKDMYQMHGIIRDEEICQICEKRFDKHDNSTCDQNWWVETKPIILSLPWGWPKYDSSKFKGID